MRKSNIHLQSVVSSVSLRLLPAYSELKERVKTSEKQFSSGIDEAVATECSKRSVKTSPL